MIHERERASERERDTHTTHGKWRTEGGITRYRMRSEAKRMAEADKRTE